MIQLAPRPAPRFIGQEFNRFLFALVGTDRYGHQLSVVSALARLDLDAWAEAAALARLPRDAAVNKLANILRRYTEIPRLAQESPTVAAGLIALLPDSATPLPMRLPRTERWVASGAGLVILLALGLVLGMQYAKQTPSPPAAAIATAAPSLAPAPNLP